MREYKEVFPSFSIGIGMILLAYLRQARIANADVYKDVDNALAVC
jgi:hypothetical protein